MSHSTSSRNRKRSSTSAPTATTKTSKTTPYSGNFEQKIIDNGIYPDEFEHPDGRERPDPANLADIQGVLSAARPSLSPSRCMGADFKAFKRETAKASGETTALYKVLPFIAGKETSHHRSEADLPFNNLKPFDKDLSDPKPDVHYGAPPSAIDRRVRSDLGQYIIPTTTTSRPAAPNFFVEGKSAKGRGDVAKNQALHDGAVGARAMHRLQNYGADELVYDNNAYSYSTTYQSPLLQIYATHPTQPIVPGGEPEYHMTQLGSYSLTHNADRFREGAAAYRNIRDLAMTQRGGFIDQANQVARQMPATSPTTTFTDSRTSLSTTFEAGSDTSEDVPARDEGTPVKRLRPAPDPRSHIRRRPTERNTTARSDPPKSTDTTSRCHPSDSATPSSRQQRGESRSIPEVPSERMRYDGEWGWYVEYKDKSIFVPDSRWTSCEKNGRQALYCSRLDVFTYQSMNNR